MGNSHVKSKSIMRTTPICSFHPIPISNMATRQPSWIQKVGSASTFDKMRLLFQKRRELKKKLYPVIKGIVIAEWAYRKYFILFKRR